MLSVVAYHQHPNGVFIPNPIEHREWESMCKTASDVRSDRTVESGVSNDSLNRSIDFFTEFGAKSNLLPLVEFNSIV